MSGHMRFRGYCPSCGEPACFCDEGHRPSIWWTGMLDDASAMSGCAQDRETGLGPKGASAVPEGETPQ